MLTLLLCWWWIPTMIIILWIMWVDFQAHEEWCQLMEIWCSYVYWSFGMNVIWIRTSLWYASLCTNSNACILFEIILAWWIPLGILGITLCRMIQLLQTLVFLKTRQNFLQLSCFEFFEIRTAGNSKTVDKLQLFCWKSVICELNLPNLSDLTALFGLV